MMMLLLLMEQFSHTSSKASHFHLWDWALVLAKSLGEPDALRHEEDEAVEKALCWVWSEQAWKEELQTWELEIWEQITVGGIGWESNSHGNTGSWRRLRASRQLL
jgi:hypothetical protein